MPVAGMPFQVSILVAATTGDEAAEQGRCKEQVEIVRRRLSMRQEKRKAKEGKYRLFFDALVGVLSKSGHVRADGRVMVLALRAYCRVPYWHAGAPRGENK